MRHLIDTSAWIEALRRDGDTETRRLVIELAREGEAVVCEMILLELWNGARGKKEADVVRSLEAELDLIPILPIVWRAAYALAADCRAGGVTIPATDLIIAAAAHHYQLGLLHRDAHFDQIEKVRARRSR